MNLKETIRMKWLVARLLNKNVHSLVRKPSSHWWMTLTLAVVLLGLGWARAELIVRPEPKLPLTAFDLVFRTGSAQDPVGQEGLAFLVGEMLAHSGVGVPAGKAWNRLRPATRDEFRKRWFELGAEPQVFVSREQTSVKFAVAQNKAEAALDLLAQMFLSPQFSIDDLKRLQQEQLNYLKVMAPREDQEELGKAALVSLIYGENHPYSHVVEGRVHSVSKLSLEVVESFYKSAFTRSHAYFALGGVVSTELRRKAQALLDGLPRGEMRHLVLAPAPVLHRPYKVTLVEGPFNAVGIHMGLSHSLQRGTSDFSSAYASTMGFGKHRTFVGRLMKQVREIRGLNYGTYAYLEEFPMGGQLLTEPLHVMRQRQDFTIWARPTPVENACFLMRQLLREWDQFSSYGLSNEEFKNVQRHLMGAVPLLSSDLSRMMGYLVDAEVAGLHLEKTWPLYLAHSIGLLNATQARRQIRSMLHNRPIQIVVVTPDAKRFRKEILSEKCEIHYPEGVEKSPEIRREDELISRYRVGFSQDDIEVRTPESFFE